MKKLNLIEDDLQFRWGGSARQGVRDREREVKIIIKKMLQWV